MIVVGIPKLRVGVKENMVAKWNIKMAQRMFRIWAGLSLFVWVGQG